MGESWYALLQRISSNAMAKKLCFSGTSKCGMSLTSITGHTTPEEYWKLYDYAVASACAPRFPGQGWSPVSTSPGRPKAYMFLNNFLEHVNSDKSAADGKPIPMDFISFSCERYADHQGWQESRWASTGNWPMLTRALS